MAELVYLEKMTQIKPTKIVPTFVVVMGYVVLELARAKVLNVASIPDGDHIPLNVGPVVPPIYTNK